MECACFIVAGFVLPLIICCFLSTLAVVLASDKSRGTTEYVLMDFAVLKLLTVSLNTGSSLESEE